MTPSSLSSSHSNVFSVPVPGAEKKDKQTMLSDFIRQDDSARRLDRSKCVFPASSAASTTAKRATTIEVLLASRRRDSGTTTTTRTPDIAFPTLLKAAWILTLQCFIVADIIGFRYNGPIQVHDEKIKDVSLLYLSRVDPNERVRSFLQRLDQCRPSATTTVPTGYDIGVVDAHSSHHHCNTAICFRRQGAEQDGSTPISSPNPKMHLNVRVTSSSSRDSAALEYNLSHTSQDMAASVMRTFQHIYAQFVNASDNLLLRDVEVCSELDRAIIKRSTQMDPTPVSSCLHDLILEQCRMRPNEMAVYSWDGNLTYKELDDLSLRLARYLVQLGVGPEVFVLSCFEKSTWAIVARLAVLRAGGAYISIHASNPPIYLRSVITRTKTNILLTDPHFANRFRNAVPTVVELSPEWLQSLLTGDDSKVCDTVQPDSACLVLFTSGSTGTPKGIIQTHKAYATAIQNYARDLKLGAHTRYLQFDDYAFDISNLEFLVPLILGGCCCVPKPMTAVHDLIQQINTLNANTMFITPTVAIKLEPADVPCLHNLCVGGEPIPKDLVVKWDSSSTKLINQYGMGEAAICCALNTNIDPVDGARVGRPSTGTIWLVDPSSPEKLMPVGAIGEIMIEGPHLSRGYLDQAVLRRTEAGFLTKTPRWMSEMHPNRSSAQIYRSGDLGRRNSDGTITYLGRKDTILKLDGCRIDALEVEHQARKCLSVKDTIVVDLLGIINGKEDPSLTAFLYLEEHPSSTAPVTNGAPLLKDATDDSFAANKVEEIKASIAQSLPRYMIPTTFVLMTWIPRTGSKKIDRKKMHMFGQTFYFSQLEQRTKHISYAQRVHALPI
ncbi:hypothetical protein G7Y89_g14948 [Cudoniella acicularis]|uniref:AMP-dependent synthetase/ligase domain-containing protein n=1 Tax=Cudoniella acicularis TaxID=354080 RepID=A0A8H4QX79_9HELO|nr:hypothetical protein G7Y89_g14948 [Cudoniella acicularis]